MSVLQKSMRTMQLTEEDIGEVLRLLAGVLHAGNIDFMTAGGAQVSSKSGEAPAAPSGGRGGKRALTDALLLQPSAGPPTFWA